MLVSTSLDRAPSQAHGGTAGRISAAGGHYVISLVTPAERQAAASLTAVPRSLAAALGPSLAGWMLGAATFAWPLLLAGALKIAYDLALLARFRHIRPPEEQQQ